MDADRRNQTCKAGTTIDTDITSTYSFDWYTQSHASLLGTGRSVHYTVLVDDSKFSADVLQQLVYNLCFTYARCTRSVSYATPAYCECSSFSFLPEAS
jgi:eukaryotic translation initiation factor 2C